LRYLYTDHIAVDFALQLAVIADQFEMTALKVFILFHVFFLRFVSRKEQTICEALLCENINTATAIDVFLFVSSHSCLVELKEQSLSFIFRNWSALQNKEALKGLASEFLFSLLSESLSRLEKRTGNKVDRVC
jgi:hypothetical protein